MPADEVLAKQDVIIIGGGPAGYCCAIRAAQLGKKVALIEKEKIGGVCLNIGCIPTKSYLHLAEILARSVEVKRAGIHFSPPQISLPEMKRWVFEIVEKLTRGIEYLLKQNGCIIIKDEAEILSSGKIRIKSEGAILNADNVVIATGSRPAPLRELPFDGKNVISSNEALKPEDLPKTLLIIGGGVIGLEMATIYSRLGTKVTVVEIMAQILSGIDEEVANRLRRILESQGIKIHLGRAVVDAEYLKEGMRIRTREIATNKEDSFNAEKVLVAIGRIPNTENLGLEDAGIDCDKKGFITVDENFQTTRKNFYAIGDCSSPPLLAHKAMFEGKRVAEIIAGVSKNIPKPSVPNCIYTDPEIATIGLQEFEAKERGYSPKVCRIPLTAIGRAHTLSRTEGLAKAVLVEEGKVIGFSLLSPHASEMIGEIALLMQSGLNIEVIANVLHPHPSLSEIIPETAESFLGKGIHTLNK